MLQDGLVRLTELKTRSRPSLPSESQQQCTRLQLAIYKLLWDELVLGKVDLGEEPHHAPRNTHPASSTCLFNLPLFCIAIGKTVGDTRIMR